MIEAMESRRLFAAPAVTAITLTGRAEEVTGVVLTFRVPLDPASAQNVKAYSASKKTKGDDASIGLIDVGSGGKTRKVRFSSAVYDAAAQTVTLTPTAPFHMARRFRRLRIDGTGANAIRDASGVPIDGDGNGKPGGNDLIHARIVHSSHFNFKEADGDSGRLKLTGPGKLWVYADKRLSAAPVVFLTGTNPGKSTLTGTVVRGRRFGDGIVTIHQLSAASSASTPLLSDPAFRVEVVNP